MVLLWEQHLQANGPLRCAAIHVPHAQLFYIYDKQYVSPQRAVCAESVLLWQRGHTISTLTADDCYREKKSLHISRETEKIEGGLRGTMWLKYHRLWDLSDLPAPASADSPHLRDEPEPDGLHGSAWRSPPWRIGPSPASQPPPEALWCWPPLL